MKLQDRTVSWPVQGDRATFRRRVALLVGTGVAAITASLAVATLADPSLLRPLLPLAAGALLLVLLGTHGTARSLARRTEVERSFAGLVVLHLGVSYAVAEQPILGEFATRRDAAMAALDRGGWAIIIHAWDRFYLLDARPTGDAAGTRRAPVSFRSRAVADVVPAIRDEAIA